MGLLSGLLAAVFGLLNGLLGGGVPQPGGLIDVTGTAVLTPAAELRPVVEGNNITFVLPAEFDLSGMISPSLTEGVINLAGSIGFEDNKGNKLTLSNISIDLAKRLVYADDGKTEQRRAYFAHEYALTEGNRLPKSRWKFTDEGANSFNDEFVELSRDDSDEDDDYPAKHDDEAFEADQQLD